MKSDMHGQTSPDGPPWRMPVLRDLNERAISLEEVGKAVNEIKSGKAPGLDGFPVECLKKGGMACSVGMAG